MAKEKKPRAPKAPKPPLTADELIVVALKAAATKPKANWSGTSGAVLFNTKEENHLTAIEQATAGDTPLLRQVGKGGALTAEGFARLLELSPGADAAELATSYATNLDANGRATLIAALEGRTSGPHAERFSAAAMALQAEEQRQADERVRQAEQAKFARYRQAAALHRAAEARLLRELATCRAEAAGAEQTLAALEAALADAGTAAQAEAIEPSRPALRVMRTESGEGPQPTTGEQKEFRRYTADRLAAAWRDAWDENKAEGRDYLETAIWNIRGMKMIGEVGQQVPFDGRLHESDVSVFTNGPVRVARPGWLLKVDDEDYVALKAAVEKV